MPYLHIRTNQPVADGDRPQLLEQATRAVSDALGKSDRYVMVSLEVNPDMLFAGDDAPLAYLELKSIGLPEDRTAALSEALCAFVEQSLGVAPERTYVELANAPRHLWGWNRGTF
jgi:phenylpyruvate tautomerase PptA (4-oxalocrotonate tautomerase family)